MSHFSVIVIGPDIEAQLQPYHEFECTGTNDQYIVEVDITEQLRADYETGTRTMYNMPDGCRVGWGDDRLYRNPTDEERKLIGTIAGTGCGHGLSWSSRDWGDGKGYRTKIHDPASFGAVEVELPYREVMTFLAYVEYERGEQVVVRPGETPDTEGSAKYGYVRVDEHGNVVQVIDRTNPNAKWDYWRIGGRWRGMLRVKPGATNTLLSDEPWEVRMDREDGRKIEPPTGVDQCRRGDLDLDAVRVAAFDEAHTTFNKWERLIAEHGRAQSWAEIREQHAGNIDAARATYRAQPLIQHADKSEKEGGMGFTMRCWVEELGYDRDAYWQRCVLREIVPYAVVKDGKWFARGEMGWWGVSHDETDEDQWCKQFHALLADLPPDTMLTVVDCHI